MASGPIYFSATTKSNPVDYLNNRLKVLGRKEIITSIKSHPFAGGYNHDICYLNGKGEEWTYGYSQGPADSMDHFAEKFFTHIIAAEQVAKEREDRKRDNPLTFKVNSAARADMEYQQYLDDHKAMTLGTLFGENLFPRARERAFLDFRYQASSQTRYESFDYKDPHSGFVKKVLDAYLAHALPNLSSIKVELLVVEENGVPVVQLSSPANLMHCKTIRVPSSSNMPWYTAAQQAQDTLREWIDAAEQKKSETATAPNDYMVSIGAINYPKARVEYHEGIEALPSRFGFTQGIYKAGAKVSGIPRTEEPFDITLKYAKGDIVVLRNCTWIADGEIRCDGFEMNGESSYQPDMRVAQQQKVVEWGDGSKWGEPIPVREVVAGATGTVHLNGVPVGVLTSVEYVNTTTTAQQVREAIDRPPAGYDPEYHDYLRACEAMAMGAWPIELKHPAAAERAFWTMPTGILSRGAYHNAKPDGSTSNVAHSLKELLRTHGVNQPTFIDAANSRVVVGPASYKYDPAKSWWEVAQELLPQIVAMERKLNPKATTVPTAELAASNKELRNFVDWNGEIVGTSARYDGDETIFRVDYNLGGELLNAEVSVICGSATYAQVAVELIGRGHAVMSRDISTPNLERLMFLLEKRLPSVPAIPVPSRDEIKQRFLDQIAQDGGGRPPVGGTLDSIASAVAASTHDTYKAMERLGQDMRAGFEQSRVQFDNLLVSQPLTQENLKKAFAELTKPMAILPNYTDFLPNSKVTGVTKDKDGNSVVSLETTLPWPPASVNIPLDFAPAIGDTVTKETASMPTLGVNEPLSQRAKIEAIEVAYRTAAIKLPDLVRKQLVKRVASKGGRRTSQARLSLAEEMLSGDEGSLIVAGILSLALSASPEFIKSKMPWLDLDRLARELRLNVETRIACAVADMLGMYLDGALDALKEAFRGSQLLLEEGGKSDESALFNGVPKAESVGVR